MYACSARKEVKTLPRVALLLSEAAFFLAFLLLFGYNRAHFRACRVGACFGRILGLAVQHLQWTHPDLRMFHVCKGDMYCVNPGVYAMVGAAATLSGVTVSRSTCMHTSKLTMFLFLTFVPCPHHSGFIRRIPNIKLLILPYDAFFIPSLHSLLLVFGVWPGVLSAPAVGSSMELINVDSARPFRLLLLCSSSPGR